MARRTQAVTTAMPVTATSARPRRAAAAAMTGRSVGDVRVTGRGALCCVRDRDDVVRVPADGRDLRPIAIGSGDAARVTPDDAVSRAVGSAVGRTSVVDRCGGPVGPVSKGDRAVGRDERSARTRASAPPPRTADRQLRLPRIDPDAPVPDDPGPLLPDTPEKLPPPPPEPAPMPSAPPEPARPQPETPDPATPEPEPV